MDVTEHDPPVPAAPAGTTLDLTPRTGAASARPRRSKGRGWAVGIVLVLVLGAISFLLFKQLSSASLYYYNADQAVAHKAELGSSRFRIQGTFEGTETNLSNGDVKFAIVFNGVKVIVDHSGAQPALFQPGVQVVLDGRWSPNGSEFLSDQIEVKHSATYIAEHPGRVNPTNG